MSLVLKHFWAFVNLLFGGILVPSKYFLSGETPALIQSNVGSSSGISGLDLIIKCFLDSKKMNPHISDFF